MILLIDNYDSFTYNLYQFIGIFNNDIKVVRNDKITIEEIEALDPESIVISPGPKSPLEAGISVEVIKHFTGKKPILGICLGHQSIGVAFGATVSYARQLMHGKQSEVIHNGSSIFEGIPSPVKVARYHSLAIIEGTLPDELEVIARTDDGEIMAVKHRTPCTRAAPTTTVLRGMRTPATCIGSASRRRTDCPSVTVWLPCTHAGMVLRPTAVEVPTAVWNPKFRPSACVVMNSLSVMGCASAETMRSVTCPTGCAIALPLRTVFLSSSISVADGCCVVPPCPAGIYLAANS